MIAGPDGLGEFEFPELVFSRSKLFWATFSDDNEPCVDLHNSSFDGAKINPADLSGANLAFANFDGADLSGSMCYKTDFTGASMLGTKLCSTTFKEAVLSDAKVWHANFDGASFDLKPKSLPYLPYLAAADNLEKLEFIYSEASLAELRSALKDAALRQAERKINYALQRQRTAKLGYQGHVIDYWFRYVFFDLTCAYGMVPGRPLLIIVAASVVFTVPYLIAVCFGTRSAIWAVRNEDSVHKRKRPTRALRVTLRARRTSAPVGKIWQLMISFVRAAGVALFFSILTAFSIGFREINVGNWITRLQSREYTLRPTGWVRCVAGFQSLLSVYLLALWVLAYFGRPFE